MALALGTVGHVGHLRCLSVGPFSEADAISLAFLEELEHKDAAFEHLKPVTSALDDIPALPVSAGEAANSVMVRHRALALRLKHALPVADRGTGVAPLGDQPVALVTVKAGKIQPLRVFNP